MACVSRLSSPQPRPSQGAAKRHRLPPRIQTPAIIQRRTNFAFPGPGRRQGNQHSQSSPDVLLPKSGRRGTDKHQCSLRPSGCGFPLCSIIQKGWGWLGLGRRCRRNPEDMHRPPPPPLSPTNLSPPLPSCMYGTLPCHMPCACLLPPCTGPVKRTGGVSGTPSGVVRLRTVRCVHSPRLPHTSRRRHRAASGMVRRCSRQSLRGGLTPSVTAWIADTPGKGRGKGEVSLFVAVPHRRVECRIGAAVKEEDTQ